MCNVGFILGKYKDLNAKTSRLYFLKVQCCCFSNRKICSLNYFVLLNITSFVGERKRNGWKE